MTWHSSLFPAALGVILAILYQPVRSAVAEDGEWTIDDVIAAVQHREQMLQSVEARVECHHDLTEWGGFSSELEQYQQRLARFHGFTRENRSATSDGQTQNPPPEYYYFRRAPSQQLRLRRFSSLEMADNDLLFECCFDGTTWEQQILTRNSPGPTVVIDDRVALPPVLAFLGIGYPVNANTGELFPHTSGRPQLLSDFLLHARDSGHFEVELQSIASGATVKVTVLHELAKASASATYFARITLHFLPDWGFAPSQMEKSEVRLIDGEFQEVPMPIGFDVNWDKYIEHEGDSSVWVAGTMTVRPWMVLPIPPDQGEFQPRIVNGIESSTNGHRDIDYEQTVLTRFNKMMTHYNALSVDFIDTEPTQICGDDSYLAGTIVENRITGEVFQLLGDSPARSDSGNHRLLDGPSMSAGAPRRNMMVPIVICVNVAFLLAVVVVAYQRRRRVPQR